MFILTESLTLSHLYILQDHHCITLAMFMIGVVVITTPFSAVREGIHLLKVVSYRSSSSFTFFSG